MASRRKHSLIALLGVALASAGLVLPMSHFSASGETRKAAARPSSTVTVTKTVTATATVTATVTATATATVTQTVTATPTSTDSATPTATATPTPTETTPTSTPPPATGFPTAATAGVPAGWVPKTARTGDYTITQAGAVVEDLRVTNGSILVRAPNVTLRRVELLGGIIHNEGNNGCHNGLVIEDTSIGRAPGQTTRDSDWSVVMVGGYTARNVKITGVPEGFRVGGDSVGCGPVVIENSYAHVVPPDVCGDWHGDNLQGYDGDAVTVRNTVLKLSITPSCGATSPFFYPSGQGNTRADIDGLIVDGGGYPFRLGTPGTVKNLHIIEGSWAYGPISVACGLVSSWQASISRMGADGQPTVVRAQPCNTTDGS